MKNKSLFADQFFVWPLGMFNQSVVVALIVLFVLLILGHILSFLFNCVWFYQPQQLNSCHNHRPAIIFEKKTVELDVVKSTTLESTNNRQNQVLNLKKILVDSNVRQGPGMGYTTMAVLQSGAQVEILETQDGWHKIRRIGLKESIIDEPIGWVWSEQID